VWTTNTLEPFKSIHRFVVVVVDDHMNGNRMLDKHEMDEIRKMGSEICARFPSNLVWSTLVNKLDVRLISNFLSLNPFSSHLILFKFTFFHIPNIRILSHNTSSFITNNPK